MTALSDEFKSAFTETLGVTGEQIRLKYYNQQVTGDYDDDVTLTQSGTDLWISGAVQPISSKQFSSDSLLLEQGKILLDDKKIYVNGSVQTSGLGPIKIGMNGSPTTEQYQILNEGQVTQWDLNGIAIYKKLFVRYLNTGSFIGE
jgi:hypothetical protein